MLFTLDSNERGGSCGFGGFGSAKAKVVDFYGASKDSTSGVFLKCWYKCGVGQHRRRPPLGPQVVTVDITLVKLQHAKRPVPKPKRKPREKAVDKAKTSLTRQPPSTVRTTFVIFVVLHVTVSLNLHYFHHAYLYPYLSHLIDVCNRHDFRYR